jgi:cytochrome c biogenesis protein
MKRLFDYIGSRRFAVRLLVAITLIILASNLLPKPYIMTESELARMKAERPFLYEMGLRFNVERATKSPYFIAAAIFLFASITVCTARRVRGRLEGEGAGIPPVSTMQIRHDLGEVPRALVHDMRGLPGGWRWEGGDIEGGRVYYARKGVGGFWGSAVFHAGMCVVLIGALVSALTRYNGRLFLTEDFDIDPARELKGLSENQRYVFPIRGMALRSFAPVYEGPFPVDYSADIAGLDLYGREFSRKVRVNEPMRSGGYQFTMSRYGFAPRFVLKDGSGKVVSDHVVNLAVITPDRVDSFRLLDGMVTARVRFFPDFYIDTERGRPATRSRDLKRPVFLVSLERFGKEKEGGFLPLGGGVSFDGYTLEFKELRWWVLFDVSKDSGVPVITAGFLLIAGGLILRLLLNEKAVWIILNEEARAGVGGRAGFFPALFEEELRRLAEELKSEAERLRG